MGKGAFTKKLVAGVAGATHVTYKLSLVVCCVVAPFLSSCRQNACAGGADWGLAEAVEEGSILGPTVLFTGHALSQTGGHGDMRGRGEEVCSCGAALRGLGRVCDGVGRCEGGKQIHTSFVCVVCVCVWF